MIDASCLIKYPAVRHDDFRVQFHLTELLVAGNLVG